MPPLGIFMNLQFLQDFFGLGGKRGANRIMFDINYNTNTINVGGITIVEFNDKIELSFNYKNFKTVKYQTLTSTYIDKCYYDDKIDFILYGDKYDTGRKSVQVDKCDINIGDHVHVVNTRKARTLGDGKVQSIILDKQDFTNLIVDMFNMYGYMGWAQFIFRIDQMYSTMKRPRFGCLEYVNVEHHNVFMQVLDKIKEYEEEIEHQEAVKTQCYDDSIQVQKDLESSDLYKSLKARKQLLIDQFDELQALLDSYSDGMSALDFEIESLKTKSDFFGKLARNSSKAEKAQSKINELRKKINRVKNHAET